VDDPLVSCWKRADLQNPAFCEEELRAWPRGLRNTFTSAGILYRIEDARSVDCDACGEHIAEVVRDPKHLEAPYYLCAQNGRVSLKPQDLQRWGFAFDRLAEFLNRSLGLAGQIIEVVAGRVWLLGRLHPHTATAEIFLFRGIWWPDAACVLNRSLRLRQSARAIVLSVRRFPPEQLWGQQQAVVLALSEVTSLDASGFVILRERIIETVPAARTEYPTPLKVSRSMGSAAAVDALLALKGKKGWTMEELARHLGTTSRTLQGLTKTRVVRSSVFRAMAERLGITPEDLLAGKVPDTTKV